MAGWRRGGGPAQAVLAGVGLTVLAIGVIVLSVQALQQTGAQPTDARATPKPTFTFGAPAPTPPGEAGSPTPSPTGGSGAAPGADERFLAVGEDVLWRGTAGACGADAPVIELSSDSGATWTDVTPTYRDIAQLRTLSSFGGPHAEAVADLGEECETQAIRTFTGGEFWEPYPDELASWTYVDPADAGTIITPDGAIEAPCAEPWGLRARGVVVALICDATAYARSADEWTALAPAGISALAVDADGGLALAHIDPACDGLAISRYEDDATKYLGCASDANPQGDAAVTFAGEDVLLWAGDVVTSVG